jgi:hypothetical protein
MAYMACKGPGCRFEQARAGGPPLVLAMFTGRKRAEME